MEGSISFIPQIPNDIIFDVLSRLPVKTLVRFCCICKFWQKLITSDHGFIQSQLQNSVKRLTGYENVLLSSCVGDSPQDFTCKEDPNSQPIKFSKKLVTASEKSAGFRLYFKEDKFTMAGCCDGVICFVQFSKHNFNVNLEFMIYLCNPALCQCRALPPGHYQGKFFSWDTIVSFFFDPVIHDYKVVKIIPKFSSFLVEIYSPSSNTWKPLSLKISPCPQHILQRPLVHKGFPYWISQSQQDSSHLVLNVLDITQEKIRRISFPDRVRLQYANLILFQGSLSVFGCNFKHQNELWVMTEDKKGSISWTKQLVVPDISHAYPLSNRTTGITASGRQFISSLGATVHSYDPKNQKLEMHTEMLLDGWRQKYVVADYVASLVSVIPPPVENDFYHGEILAWEK
nr:putative F-box protein At5g52610 [Coffea arabica]XP_027074292.1 putative F-box protein At5g52610 [Coffea arabica]XP_027074293.1 putative F-box protein At5g52610 [Coffea arabica]